MLELLLYNLNPHSALGKGLLGDNILNTVKKNNEKLKTDVQAEGSKTGQDYIIQCKIRKNIIFDFESNV